MLLRDLHKKRCVIMLEMTRLFRRIRTYSMSWLVPCLKESYPELRQTCSNCGNVSTHQRCHRRSWWCVQCRVAYGIPVLSLAEDFGHTRHLLFYGIYIYMVYVFNYSEVMYVGILQKMKLKTEHLQISKRIAIKPF